MHLLTRIKLEGIRDYKMKEISKTKFTNKLRMIGPKFRWFLFTELQDYKLTSYYINFICPDPRKKEADPIGMLENMVKQALIREFSPAIKRLKSFDLLVDAITHKIQTKSLEKDQGLKKRPF